MNKKGAGQMFLLIGLVIVALLAYSVFKPAGAVAGTAIASGVQPVGLAAQCISGVTYDAAFRAYNELNTSGSGSQPEYMAGRTGRVYRVPAEGSEIFLGTADSGTAAGTYSSATTLTCGAKYKLYVIGNGSQTGGEGEFVSGASGAQQDRVTLKLKDVDTLEMRAYDTLARGFVYNGSAATGNTAATTWVDAGSVAGLTAQYYSTTDNSTEMAIGAGGSAEVEYYFRMNDAGSDNAYFDAGAYWCVDTGTDDEFQKVSPASLDGARAVEVTPGSLNLPGSESQEYCWKLENSDGSTWNTNQIGRGWRQTWLAKAGVNPDDNPIVTLYSARKFVSTIDGSVKGPAIVDDASSPNVLRTATKFTQRIS